MIRFFIFLSILLSHTVFAAQPDNILGTWKVIDERTGKPTGEVTIKKDRKTNLYYGMPTKTYKKGRTMDSLCSVCPGQYKNKPLRTIPVLWNFKYDKKKKKYSGGYALHFLTGKIYNGDIKLTKNGNSLHMRGSVMGARFLGKTNIWIRVK